MDIFFCALDNELAVKIFQVLKLLCDQFLLCFCIICHAIIKMKCYIMFAFFLNMKKNPYVCHSMMESSQFFLFCFVLIYIFQISEVGVVDKHSTIDLPFIGNSSRKKFQNFLQITINWQQTSGGNKEVMTFLQKREFLSYFWQMFCKTK